MNNTSQVTVAICCYNAEKYLPKLLDQLTGQSCPLPWEILIVDNNSHDNSVQIIDSFTKSSKTSIRYVLESEQGIPYARNRAIEESTNSEFLVFIDADELPDINWLSSAINCLKTHSADCVGGEIDLELVSRPAWLCDNLLPFLGLVKHGHQPFQIKDRSTPVWSGNIAYRMSLFNGGLRFDTRYNRKGKGVGGGEDGMMFRHLLETNSPMFYEPKMRIVHLIPPEKLTRSYFLKLHYIAGKKFGLYELSANKNKAILGVPRYMFLLVARQCLTTLKFTIIRHPGYMREAMNVSYFLGQMIGLAQKHNVGKN